jgi:FkbH-like protein
VRANVPEVTVIELPPDATRYARLLGSSGWFDTLSIGEEDRRRSEMYRTESRRTELRASAESMPAYLASLGMVLTIARATPFSLPRIAQLTQKTNQFNLTTRRYSEGDVRAMMDDVDWRVYYAELEDSFDRAGIIAVALVHDRDSSARIDTLLMSCRVIGRGVEQALLAIVAREAAQRGQRTLVGEYIPTAKNPIVSDFYQTAGFVANRQSDGAQSAGGWWEYPLDGSLPVAPEWFREIRFADKLVEA